MGPGSSPLRPHLPGALVVREDSDAILDAAAAELLVHAKNCVRAFGDFHLALSGAARNEPLFRRLMLDPNYRDLPWSRVHLWMVEEAVVPVDDPRRRFSVLQDWIIQQADIPEEQVHPIRAEAAEPDALYQADLRECLGWREKGHDRLDYALLGVEDSGFTAGIYPDSPAMLEDDRLVHITSPEGRTFVSLTLPMLNAARFVAVLLSGAEAAPIVASLDASAGRAPLLSVRPKGGELRWYLDQAALGPGA